MSRGFSEKQETVDVLIEVPKLDSSGTENSGESHIRMCRKQQLSPYFIIAAAAFGLISDGCE